jgi:hypothetical protein
MIEAKLKHLEFIQGAINRMATTSFLRKGWAITIVGGLFALTFKEISSRYLYISLVVLLLFWWLDALYLSHERNFVRLSSTTMRLISRWTAPRSDASTEHCAAHFQKRFSYFTAGYSRSICWSSVSFKRSNHG